jgi:hypothetical protein
MQAAEAVIFNMSCSFARRALVTLAVNMKQRGK